MNKQRRKALEAITKRITEGDLADLISEIKGEIEELMEEEQEYYDNMPESFQYGDKGEAAEAAVNALDYAIGELDDPADLFTNVISYIEEACE